MRSLDFSSEDSFDISINDEDFKQLFSLVPSPVYIIACIIDNYPTGITVSSFRGLSLSPPLVCFNLNLKSRLLTFFKKDQTFTANALSDNQAEIAQLFAQSSVKVEECRSQLEAWPDKNTFRIRESPCTLLLKCVEVIVYGDHVMVISHIKYHSTNLNSMHLPRLIYANRKYTALNER